MCRDVVIVGSSVSDSPPVKEGTPGDVRAYDVRTGALRWTFHVIPRAGEFGVDTWKDDSWKYTGAANLWALISADETLGYAYLPLTSPTSDMYGGHRPGDNLFSDSLVAVNCQTGQRVWHYQLVHHDLWDYDLPAAPVLADIKVDGRNIKAVVQVTKQGFAFVFDRVTGRPVWPIEERPVPQSETPGEQTSPTQPFPTKPPPFERQGVTIDDLIDFTPELRAAALDIVKRYVIGPLFTPPSIKGAGPSDTKGTIQLPGSVGGADWQGAAFDPETGILYVESITGPFVADLVEGRPAETNLRWVRGTQGVSAGADGPSAAEAALRSNHRDRPQQRGARVDGAQRRRPPRSSAAQGSQPAAARPSRAAAPRSSPRRCCSWAKATRSWPTRGGCPRACRSPWRRAPAAGSSAPTTRRRARCCGRSELPAGTTGAPMSYMFQGKQYVVVAIGSREHPAEYVAWSLP